MTEKNACRGSRDRLCFLLSHAMLCRSQNALGMQFADLFSLEIGNQGISKCVALVITVTFGKTNQHGKIEYGSSVRNRDVEVCFIVTDLRYVTQKDLTIFKFHLSFEPLILI